MKVMVVFGTRPEAIKLAPLLTAFQAHPEVEVRSVATGQHRRILDHALAAFGVVPDVDLDLMQPGQQPDDVASRVLAGLRPVLDRERPDWVIVQGDTTSALAGALAASWHEIPVAHVEAGLRSGDLAAPFPEEGNRRLIDQVARLHFAPTQTARAHLLAEGRDPDGITVTGNTGIDALLRTWERVREVPLDQLEPATRGIATAPGPLVLLTAHRRESVGAPIDRICTGILRIARQRTVRVVVPVHPNPAVDGPIRSALHGAPGVFLLPPLPYPAMVRLLGMSDVVLTDSGGLQEEAPSLGRKVLVCREHTERTEGIEVGAAIEVGTDADRIEAAVLGMLDDPQSARFLGVNPYGDGHAAERIANVLAGRASAARRFG